MRCRLWPETWLRPRRVRCLGTAAAAGFQACSTQPLRAASCHFLRDDWRGALQLHQLLHRLLRSGPSFWGHRQALQHQLLCCFRAFVWHCGHAQLACKGR